MFLPSISKTEELTDKEKIDTAVVKWYCPRHLAGQGQIIINQEMPSFKFLTDKELVDAAYLC